MSGIGSEISLWIDQEATDGHGIDVLVESVLAFVNRDVELLKGVTRNSLEVLEVNRHTLDQLVVVQERRTRDCL